MDSFANSDITYDDGQLNREPVPEEIVVYGFKPPIRLPDGSIQEGDYLSANHLNYLLNDIYKKIKSSLAVIEKSGDSNGGYRRFANGDIEAWGRSTTGSDGSITVSYPFNFPGATNDIQVTDTASGHDSISVKVSLGSTSTGFTIRASNASGAAVSGRVILWKATYHG